MDEIQTYLEVNLDHFYHNYKELRRITKLSRLAGVVKANAYGLGAAVLSRELERYGIDYLCVATITEAIELRRNRIYKPLLVLGYVPAKRLKDLIEYNIETTVYDFDTAVQLNEVAKELDTVAKIHIKIDSGMHRLGYLIHEEKIEETIQEIIKIYKLPHVKIEGIYSHFSDADAADHSYTEYQYDEFLNIIKRMEQLNLSIPIYHIANDAGAIMFGYNLDMVRCGLGLYGYYSSDIMKMNHTINLKEVAKLYSVVTSTKELEKGNYIGYNRTYQSDSKIKLATVAIGYADGYSYGLSNKGDVLINSTRCPVIGKVCMDQIMVDVTNANVKKGDSVLLFGNSEEGNISIYEMANRANSFVYEFLCNISMRIPRVYIRNNERVAVKDYVESR